ncbi:MAG: zinc-binding dehydrogenase, partial [Dehalococcoidia bacterium]|jgi:L-iditol 2-dehydrogenase|nr:zinc-binding dehydrogenase [Dehalococcoidia bacterium]
VDRGVFPLPEEVSFEEATFTEPLACVLRGQRLAGMRPGMSVMVIGSGIAGLLHIQAARALGVGRIVATDVVDFRLEAALRFGAGYAIHAEEAVPERLRQLFDGWLPDISIVCAGATGAIEQGLRSVERGGTVLLFAPGTPGATVPLQVNDAWFNGTNIVTTYAGSPTDYVTALELIRARRVPVGEMITHRLGLAETDWGFQLVAEARDSIKVIIEPQK